MFLQILLAIILLLVVKNFGYFRDYHARYQKAKHIPSFGNVPFIGSLPFIPLDFEKFTQFYIDFANKTVLDGKSVMCGWFGTELTVIPLTGDAVKVLTNSTTELVKGRDYKFVERWLGPSLLLGDGERWHRTRKMVTPGFHFQKLEEYAPVMDRHVRVLTGILREFEDGAQVNLFNYVKHCALDIIAEAAMGVDLNAQKDTESPYVQCVQRYNRLAVLYSQNPYYSFFDHFLWKWTGLEKETVETLRTLKDMTDNVIATRIRAQKEETDEFHEYRSKPDFLGLMLKAYEEGQIPFEQLREEVDTFMFAGHDTTSHAVAWTLWCLATHPHVQSRLHAELEEAFGGRDEQFASGQLKNLAYLDQVFKEAIRMFSPVPILERQLQDDMDMGGFTIPADTTVHISPLALHRNPKAFPSPATFDPERFADERPTPAEYIPFSAGPRNCIGQRFAQREVKILIAHLVHNFRLSTEVPFEANKPIAEVVLRPKLGVPVRLHRRF